MTRQTGRSIKDVLIIQLIKKYWLQTIVQRNIKFYDKNILITGKVTWPTIYK